jgi:phage-related protein
MSQAKEPLKRQVVFAPESARKREFFELPRAIAIQFALQLEERIALGLNPTLPIAHLGDGMVELKINGSPAYRCVYTLKKPGEVVVLNTFVKTTNGSDHHNVEKARKRSKDVLR